MMENGVSISGSLLKCSKRVESRLIGISSIPGKIVDENDGGIYDLKAGNTKVIKFEGLVAKDYYPIDLNITFENIATVPNPPKKVKFKSTNKSTSSRNVCGSGCGTATSGYGAAGGGRRCS